nr:cyclomaltodextrinase C-terminal domain-containing protein [Ferruginibacter sp.]
ANKFTDAGRTDKERAIWNHLARLANFRKTSSALTTGRMMQFLPVDGVYVYFRYDDKQTIMVVMNTAKEKKNVSLGRFAERTNGFTRARNVQTGAIAPLSEFALESYDSVVLELLK